MFSLVPAEVDITILQRKRKIKGEKQEQETMPIQRDTESNFGVFIIQFLDPSSPESWPWVP